MATEIEDLLEHFDRYRAVTLEHLEHLTDEQLTWRPRPDAFSCAQHFVHIVQKEDFYMRGLFERDWNPLISRCARALAACDWAPCASASGESHGTVH